MRVIASGEWWRPRLWKGLRMAALACACVGGGVPGARAADASPVPAFPSAPAGAVVDTYFGTAVPDPYRALEDLASPSTQAWMAAAEAHAEATLARIPGRAALRERLRVLETGAPVQIGRVARMPGGLLVYERRGAGENQFAIAMRRGVDAPEQVLVDPAALSRARGGVPVAVNHFAMSPDGAVLAYGISERGSEAAVLHLLDVRTGQPIGEPLDRADFGVARWTADGRAFAFNRLQPSGPDRLTRYERSAVWLVTLAEGTGRAREILGPSTRAVTVRPRETPMVLFTADGLWMLGVLEDGVSRDNRLVIAPVASLSQPEPAWRPCIEPGDRIVDFAYGAGVLYAQTYADAPRYRVIAAPIERFSAATAPTVVPASDRVLGLMVAARDALYFEAREGNAKQLWRLPHGPGSRATRVALPLEGTFALRQRGGVWNAHAAVDGVLIALEDWTHAPRWLAVSPDGQWRDTGLQPAGPFDAPDDIVTTEVLVVAPDGARVPMSVIHRRGLVRNARAPTLLLGYGAYGFTYEPYFEVHRLAWLERGGVIAAANPRGSGVYGQSWYEAGRGPTKPNTWRDMIACAEWLVASGLASPATLAIEGGSAGGITAGRAATERPDLFTAVVPRVGVLDAVRAELEPNGPPNVPEFGSHTTEPGFRALLAMSTLHHIRPGVRYPAVLLTHGVNDPRVAVWHSSKAAAQFDAARAGVPNARPVLLRLDRDAGHGVGSTRAQRTAERADIYAFLLWQLGAAGFQP